jgi:hypothetical protein
MGRAVAAVVPCWHGRAWSRADAELVRLVKKGFGGGVLQHGCTHQHEGPGLISWLTGGADELRGRSRSDLRRRLARGQGILCRVLGREPDGFLAPAWSWGRGLADDVWGLGFRCAVGFGWLSRPGFEPVALATWSWDWGRFRLLGYGGEAVGVLMHRVRSGAMPCVAIHPADVDRGFLHRIRRLVDRLENDGRRPIGLSDFCA